MQTPEFVEKFKNAESPAAIIDLYKAEGIEISEENAKASFDYMHETGELDENALEAVSGGSLGRMIGIATAATAASIAVGLLNAGDAAYNKSRIAAGAALGIANEILSESGAPNRDHMN